MPEVSEFRELGSARQVLLWAQDAVLKLPVMRRNVSVCKIGWRPAAYHTVLQILRNPIYAGAYVFGRTSQRTRVVDGRARKTTGHSKPMTAWNVLLRDHYPGYISREQFEANQQLISENAHMKSRTARKSARGGRALLTGLVRCARCGRTLPYRDRVKLAERGPRLFEDVHLASDASTAGLDRSDANKLSGADFLRIRRPHHD